MLQTSQVAIDTNVLIAAQRPKRGASANLMSLIGTNRFDIHVSIPLVFEYEAALLQHSEQLALTPEDVVEVVDAVCALAIPHKIYFLWRTYLRDRKDELVLELAVTARCDYIMTYNQCDFRGAEMSGIRSVTHGHFCKQ
jgi:putative PIN family toxin of toxin-antitoxin system